MALWLRGLFTKCQAPENFHTCFSKANASSDTGHPCNVVVSEAGPWVRRAQEPQHCHHRIHDLGKGTQPNLEPLFLHLLQRGSHFHVCCGSRHLPQAVQWLHNGGRGKYMGRGVKAKLSSFSWLRSYFGLKVWELRL